MGFLDRLLGRHNANRDGEHERQQWQQQSQQSPQPPLSQQQWQQPQQAQPTAGERPPYDMQPRERNYTDEQAIDRYTYMLRTAPPETVEQAHEEAFAKLTPEQRQMVLHDLIQSAPQHEQPALSTAQDDPRTLARLATRAEIRQPGTLVNIFGGGGMPGGYGGYSGMYGGPGYGYGGMGGAGGMFGGVGGSLLGSIAGAFIGTMIADQFLSSFGGFDRDDQGGFFDRDDHNDQGMYGQDMGSQSYDPSQDPNAAGSAMGYADDPNAGGNDFGADSGAGQDMGFGGDFGGGDFGGSDFGGDFGGGDASF